MGYRGQEYSAHIADKVGEQVAACIACGSPRASIRAFDVAGIRDDGGTPVVTLAGTALELRGKSIAAHLAGAVSVGVMAVTIGMGIDRELRRLSFVDRVGQVVFDAAATALVERAADAAEASIVAQARERGLFCNYRFSPGYGDLPLETQPTLLAAVDAYRRLGITLSESLLMSPTKSVTAVVGMFERPQPTSHASCADCPCYDFCLLRPAGRTCHG